MHISTNLPRDFSTMKEILKPDATLDKLLPPAQPCPDVTYIPSQFTVSFVHKGKQYVFHTLTRRLAAACLPASARAGEGFDELIAAQLLVPENKDECAYYRAISALLRLHNRVNGVRQYIILPTTGCNARCVYCFQEGIERITMSPETVEQTIRFIIDTHGDCEVDLHWFGGEPLLCPEIIDRVSEGLTQKGLSFRSSTITNGSLITREIVRKMTGIWHMTDVQVSMDGAEKDYRFRKNYYADRDQYRSVMEAIGMMSEAGIAVSIRCNVDEDNWDGVPRFLDDLGANVRDKAHVGLFFSPLYAVRTGEHDIAMWRKILDARRLIEEAGFKPMASEGLDLQFRIFHCMADNGSVVIHADGSLHACNEFARGSRYGDIWNGVTDEAAKNAFCRTDRIREKCRRCPYLPDCTGFASCPVYDRHCREVREIITLNKLCRIVDEADKTEQGE